MKFAPIVLFAYNRPEHLKKTVEALKKNKLAEESEIFVFCDGAKHYNDLMVVKKVFEYVDTIRGFKKVYVFKQEKNLGLGKSFIQCITQVINHYGKTIVLEDDLVTSPQFLQFMNWALETYHNEEKVISISGYVYPLESEELSDTFFVRGADCWGWATWKRGWELFEQDGSLLLNNLKKQRLEKEFDFNNSYPYVEMLEDQIRGVNDSWAVRWYASAFLANKLTLYPNKTLVRNIGFDGTGRHCGFTKGLNLPLADKPVNLNKIEVCENAEARAAFEKYFRGLKYGRFLGKIRQIFG